ncbi:MAG: ABC transporter ATP-binding protein [Bacillota bacterium]|nr:ABC transporter ATP-binding protein [Bacillota bacterium]
MISFENVSKFILSDISIHVPEGETVGLIGASGAGKTTFMKLACGLLTPERGTVYTMGFKPVQERKRLSKNMSVLFTDIPALQAEDTVAGNFEILQRIYGIDRKQFQADYKELAKRLGFAAFENQAVKNLSMGQRRRAEIGGVLIRRPKLLLLDEPTDGLDENAKQAFYELLEERKREGLTVLLTSHNMAEISRVCGRIVLVDRGKLLYYGKEQQLRKKFAPIDKMWLVLEGKIPDLEDLPIVRYWVDGNRLGLEYNSNYVTASEILKLIMGQTTVMEVKVRKPDLEDIIIRLKTEKEEKML